MDFTDSSLTGVNPALRDERSTATDPSQNLIWQDEEIKDLDEYTPPSEALQDVYHHQQSLSDSPPSHEGLQSMVGQAELTVAYPGMLQDQRHEILYSGEGEKGQLASIAKLPSEILGEVFVQCLSDGEYPYPVSHNYAPLLLMRVCSMWRRLAMATPGVWTQLNFGNSCPLNPCIFIPIWLANSGTLSLDVTFCPNRWENKWNRAEAARLVFANFHRFRSYTGEIEVQLLEELFRQGGVIYAPALESVHVWTHYQSVIKFADISVLRSRIDAPLINTINAAHPSMMDIFSFYPPYIRSLTLDVYGDEWFESSDFDPEEMFSLLDLLSSCHNISSLEIELRYDMPSIDEGRSRVLLPFLETLMVKFGPECNPDSFLESIEAPALLDFTMLPPEWAEGANMEEPFLPVYVVGLDSLLGENAPLQELALFSIGLGNSARFISILRRLKSLRSLRFENCDVNNAILEALTPDESEPPSSWLCPELSAMDLHRVYPPGRILRRLMERRPTVMFTL